MYNKLKISDEAIRRIADKISVDMMDAIARKLFDFLVENYENSGEYSTLEYENDSEKLHAVTSYFEYLDDWDELNGIITSLADDLGYEITVDKDFIDNIYHKMEEIYHK